MAPLLAGSTTEAESSGGGNITTAGPTAESWIPDWVPGAEVGHCAWCAVLYGVLQLLRSGAARWSPCLLPVVVAVLPCRTTAL